MATQLRAPVCRALSLDARLASALDKAPMTGPVHSVFRRVLNVLAADRLVALSSEGLDDAPWSVRTDVADWRRLGVEVGAVVVLDSGHIAVEGAPGIALDLRHCQKWHATVSSAAAVATDLLARRTAALEGLLDARGVPGGVVPPRADASPIEAELGRRLRAGCERLTQAVRANDDGAASLAARSLLGLGPGLTPAGDDFMVGLALVAAVPGSRLVAVGRAIRAVLDACPDHTTLVSRATLEEAVAGRARESLLGILNRVFAAPHGDDARFAEHLRTPVDRVLSIGHTSGTDILSGLVAGLRLENELRGSM
ncbi:DUF2877 domain-containing protein [Sinomonas sp. ASV322]|uniref:DUF2877 domain-containing protein n=1 Tax=Sinomonas sp. ASV322 TaxID=3041920 RepID=UPI0027DC0017|nr:DUF2877 domain-containing protein [Sinomonas sp. ASV322]MDQ4503767.1 DUF2877 domain-containing protein [Sinomonas sp. ASV322]